MTVRLSVVGSWSASLRGVAVPGPWPIHLREWLRVGGSRVGAVNVDERGVGEVALIVGCAACSEVLIPSGCPFGRLALAAVSAPVLATELEARGNVRRLHPLE